MSTVPADELAHLGAGELAHRIRHRELSSREVTLAMLDRIGRLDGPINAVVTVDVERAMAEATAADAAVAGHAELGPLHGVPLTVKDSFQTAGMRTTSGAPQLAELVPDADADCVARLRAAGAVVVGKTNLPIWAGDAQTYNEVFGTTNNPWDLRRTPGGSSGGSAAALAVGLTPLEVGSDIGGSIRIPASYCGVLGHKPSYGVVSGRGQIPGPPGTLTQADIAVVGPMARSVDDLELGLHVLAGPDDWQATAWRLELPLARRRDAKGLRVAVWADDPACPVSAAVRDAIERVAAALEGAGATVDTEARPAFTMAKAVDTFERLLSAALAGGLAPAEVEAVAATVAAGGEPEGGLGVAHVAQRHRAWLSANERRLQLRRRWREFFAEWDVVLAPITPTTAIPHDHGEPLTARRIVVDGVERPYIDQTSWPGLVGVAYLPATAVPVGLDHQGLPVGMQIVGPYLEDRTPLAVARVVGGLVGGFRPPGSAPPQPAG